MKGGAVQFEHITGLHAGYGKPLYPVTDKSQRGKACSSRHLTHLPVFTLVQYQLYPGCRNALTEADRRVTFRYRWRFRKNGRFRRTGTVVLTIYIDRYALLQQLYRFAGYRSMYLYPVLPFMGKLRVQQAVVQIFIVGEDKQALAVVIEPANRINVFRHIKEIGQHGFVALAPKTCEHLEWFVYDIIPERQDECFTERLQISTFYAQACSTMGYSNRGFGEGGRK